MMKNNDLTFCVDKSNPRKVCLSSGIIVATLANLTSNPDPQKKACRNRNCLYLIQLESQTHLLQYLITHEHTKNIWLVLK